MFKQKDDPHTNAELEIPQEHIERMCVLLKIMADALVNGRSVLVAVDCGDSVLAECFSHPEDTNAVMLVNVLAETVQKKMPLAFSPHAGGMQ
jgi:hypothetical protein